MPIPLISKIKPQNNAQIPMYDDVDGYGGYQVRVDHPDRDSIPQLNRKEGMLVFTQSDGYFWQLGASLDNTAWVHLPIASGGSVTFSGDLSGNSTSQTVVGLRGVPVVNVAPTNNQVLTYSSLDGYWKPEAPQGGTGGGGVGAGNVVSGNTTGTTFSPANAQLQNSAPHATLGDSPILAVIKIAGSGNLLIDTTVGYSFTGANQIAWSLTMLTGPFTVNGVAPTPGTVYSGITSGNIVSTGSITDLVVTPLMGQKNFASGDSTTLTATVNTHAAVGDIVGVMVQLYDITGVAPFTVGITGDNSGNAATMSLIEVGASIGAGGVTPIPLGAPPRAPTAPSGPGVDIYSDGESLDILSSGGIGTRSQSVVIVDSIGSNNQPTSLVPNNLGAFYQYGRNDIITNGWSGAGGPFTAAIYRVPDTDNAAVENNISCIATVKITGVGSSTLQSGGASWLFIVDIANPSAPVKLYGNDAFLIGDPTFSVTNSGTDQLITLNVHINDTGAHWWVTNVNVTTAYWFFSI